jgi:predicted nucleic acid-binding protein
LIHLDTSFLVDLLRERAREDRGPASRFLETIREEEIWLSVHVAAELYAGAELSANPGRERQRVERLCQGAEIAIPNEGFPRAYGKLVASQQRIGQRISTMDLLIATAAVVAGAPLVTRNVKDFSRVPGLEVLRY